MTDKPMRVMRSGLTNRVWAFRAYTEKPDGSLVVTGRKWDVTEDVQALIDDALRAERGEAP